MSLLKHIPALAEAGVQTLKIEGRMKRPEYVAAAVTACRAARDGEAYDEASLRAVFSRSGFTDGYLTGKRDGDMFGYRTKEDVVGAEGVLQSLRGLYRKERQSVPVSLALSVTRSGSSLAASDGTHTVTVEGDAPQSALNRPLDAEGAEKSLSKTGGTQYYVNEFQADIADGVMLSAAQLNALRRDALEKLNERRGAVKPFPRSGAVFREQNGRPARQSMRSAPSPLWARFCRASQLPEGTLPEKVILPLGEITPERIRDLGERLVGELPAVCFPGDEAALGDRVARLKEAGLRELWTDNIYGVALGRRLDLPVRGGFGLNIANSRALTFYEEQGLRSLTVSFELPMGAVKALGGQSPRGVAAYGCLPLMRFRNCPVRANRGCAACGGRGALTDRRGIEFPVECGERRFATLLNSVPLSIAGRDDPWDFRLLWFTRESREECGQILDAFARDWEIPGPRTGGLYYRKLM